MTESAPARPAPLRLGGMALKNGLLIHGPTSWAAAVRAPDGRIHAASGPKPVLAPDASARWPGLRGVLKLAEAFAVIPVARRRLPAARLPFEDLRVIAAMFGASAAAAILRRRGAESSGREALSAALGLLPAMVALRGSELAAYHGVEHKAIGAYERGEPDPARAPKEHERCGSNLVAPMVVSSILGHGLVRRLVERPGPLSQLGVALGSAAAAVEMFAWSERHPASPLARAFHVPGTEIQRLFATREPTERQLEVGQAALAEILDREGAAGWQPALALSGHE